MSEDTIQTFSSTPAEPTSVEELTNVEKNIEENEEETNEELQEQQADDEMTYRSRYMPIFEYGTPAGTKTIGCPSCGDAADVAILDEELSPAATVSDTEGLDGLDDSVDTEDDGDEDVNSSTLDWKQYPELYQRQLDDFELAGVEGWEAVKSYLGTLFHVTCKTLTGIFNLSEKTYKFVRNRIYLTKQRLKRCSDFWNNKLRKNMNSINAEVFSEMKIAAFPVDIWTDAVKLSLTAFDLVASGEKFMFSKDDDVFTSHMKLFKERLDKTGIEINFKINRVNVDDFLDKREFASMSELGYRVGSTPNILRYFSEIAKRIPSDKNMLEANLVHLNNLLKVQAEKEMKSVKTTNKNSEAYKSAVKNIANYTARLDFLNSAARVASILFDKVTLDAFKIFDCLEDCIDHGHKFKDTVEKVGSAVGDTISEHNTNSYFD